MAKPTFKQFREKALRIPEVRADYESLAPVYEMKRQMIALRLKAGLTQDEVAVRLETKKSNISRLESIHSGSSPRLSTVENYAQALGYRIRISFERR